MPQVSSTVRTGFAYAHISTQTTTVVKAAKGTLRGIFFNSGTSGAVITLYDNASAASGTVIAVVTLGAGITVPAAYPTLVDINFTNGLTILTATQNVDITVLYS